MRILFLCLGNICRSPAAEGIVRQMAAHRGLSLTLDSAGTGNWHQGEPPYEPMQHAARARGYDLSALRARQIVPADFERFDLILAMDPDNLCDAQKLAGPASHADLRLFLASKTPPDAVPDPYFTRDFDGTLDLIEDGARALLDQLAPSLSRM
ncbi:low molecular weight phosphotyrosine protein phosphatase [Rhodobacteraceae bacterium]|nr:low molecular weight phosphotyrosine protein phosphatase [Paracoccaceae bacterium]